MAFKEISPYDIDRNPFTLIDKDWALITAQQDGRANPMTISWGSLGILWNRPVVTAYIRPQRYTFGYLESAEGFSLTFFDETYREQLSYCGSHSGRDTDKIAHCGFTLAHQDGIPYFAEAKMVLFCKKLYAQDIVSDGFAVEGLKEKVYPNQDYHRMYIGEITKVLVQE